MSILKKVGACYLKEVKDSSGTPTGDIDFCIKAEEFQKEIQKVTMYAANDNGWVHLRIVKNTQLEGGGRYSHKIKLVD